MAAGLLTLIAESRGLAIDVRTAGLQPTGHRVAENAISVMKEVGVDISNEYSKPVTPGLLAWADVIVCVNNGHADYLIEDYPDISPKIHRLESDIRDPYGEPAAEYREVRNELQVLLSRLFDSFGTATT
jgi:protein-tyrosine phosphatase